MPLYPQQFVGGAVSGNLTVSGTEVVTGLETASSGLLVSPIATPSTPGSGSTLFTQTTGNQLSYVNAQGMVEFVGGAVAAQTSTTTIANSVTLTALQAYTVPANDPVAGSVYRIDGYGVFSTTGTPTMTFAVYWGGVGGTAVASLAAITAPTNAVNSPFRYMAIVNFRSTTSVLASLNVQIDQSVSTDQLTSYLTTVNTPVTVTTNTSNSLAIGFTWGTQSASNTISLTGGMVRRDM